MPTITTDAVAISKKALSKFIESDAYGKCKNDDLIFAEFLSDDGGRLFLFEPNQFIQLDGIDEEEFTWASIDDEDNLEVMGCWQEFPFNFDISTQMSIIVDDKSKVENLIESFDYSEDVDEDDDTYDEYKLFKDTGFDCSNSTNNTFIGVFEPDLKALV